MLKSGSLNIYHIHQLNVIYKLVYSYEKVCGEEFQNSKEIDENTVISLQRIAQSHEPDTLVNTTRDSELETNML